VGVLRIDAASYQKQSGFCSRPGGVPCRGTPPRGWACSEEPVVPGLVTPREQTTPSESIRARSVRMPYSAYVLRMNADATLALRSDGVWFTGGY
jgi:hypothetical protein